MCHQMIMGAGRRQSLALLALMRADGKSLVSQVVPAALLEFSRSVLRERFSAVVRKSIYTFHFSRTSVIDDKLLQKLKNARDTRSILVSSPSALKSFMLKLVEIMNELDEVKIREGDADPDVASRIGKLFGLANLHKVEDMLGLEDQQQAVIRRLADQARVCKAFAALPRGILISRRGRSYPSSFAQRAQLAHWQEGTSGLFSQHQGQWPSLADSVPSPGCHFLLELGSAENDKQLLR